MNKSSISNRPRNLPAIILFLVLTVILLIVAAYLWHSHTASKDQLQQLSVQNSRLCSSFPFKIAGCRRNWRPPNRKSTT